MARFQAIKIKSSLPDLVLSNNDITVRIHNKLTSNHKMILVKSKIKTVVIERLKVSRRNWEKYSPTKIMNHMLPLPSVTTNDANALNNNLVISITHALDLVWPYRILRTSRKSDLDTEMMKKKKLKKSYNLMHDKNLALKVLNRNIKSRIQAVKRQQIRTQIN